MLSENKFNLKNNSTIIVKNNKETIKVFVTYSECNTHFGMNLTTGESGRYNIENLYENGYFIIKN